MRYQIVDTNVPVVANNRSPQAGEICVLACISALEEIIHSGRIVLDTGMRILQEYTKHVSNVGQAGPGDAFIKWVWANQANSQKCEQVRITDDREREFVEFPADQRLVGFDRSDRKFVAVALTSSQDPEILNAVDSDWWNYRNALEDHGVKIRFVCPEQFSADN